MGLNLLKLFENRIKMFGFQMRFDKMATITNQNLNY